MNDDDCYDFAIVGAGIAGASVAWQLVPEARVILLEREAQPGYHSTGRSAAMFMESYGTAAIRALTRASRSFYESPPAGFTNLPLLAPRGALYIATHEQAAELHQTCENLSRTGTNVKLLNASEALERVPVLRTEMLLGAIFEEDARDIDVNALHQGYLKGFRTRGGTLAVNTSVDSASREGEHWNLRLTGGRQIRVRAVVNAAGAWADETAKQFGFAPIGLEPRRRTAFTFAPPDGMNIHDWPVVIGVDESFYFKPDAGQLIGSPANADPVQPHDVVAEEFDVALGIHQIEAHTTLAIRRPNSTWAGLRNFVPDGEFVIGWDDAADGFFWLAAQGGYGIQSAAAVSELAAALLQRRPVPDQILAQGFDATSVTPGRLR